MKKILVTGSSGLVGSEVCIFFASKGYQIHGIDNNQRAVFFGPSGDTRWNQKRLELSIQSFSHHEIDIRNRNGIFQLIKEIKPSIIIHTAAQPSHDKAADIPFDDFDTNAVGTLNLLEAARQLCPEAPFIHMSTNKVYGDAPNRITLKELPTRWEYDDASYLNGIETWNDVLLGVAGRTGLLKAWGAAVLSRSKPYYGPVEPKGGGPRMVQAQWDYFDAQQALTANFLITYLRGTGEVPTANAMHKRWMQNRTAQIRSLRGGVLAVDRFPEKIEGVLVYYLVTQLNALPNEVILHATRSGAWLMWYRRAGDAIPQGTGIDGRPMDIQRNWASAVKDTGVRDGWRLPSYAEFADLINNVSGGTRLGDGTSEKFAGNLQALGFTGLYRSPTIWFERDSKNRTVVQTENRPWFVGTHDANPNFMGHTLLVRDVSSAQAQRYVWTD